MQTKELFESPPQQVDPTNFHLDEPATNRAFIAKQLPREVEIIKQTQDFKIIRTGDGQRGWIFLYNSHSGTADYVVQYQTRHWAWFGSTVTQCILWRNPASPYVQGLTARMFFDYLLPRYSTIMSDRLQTSSGHDFWMARMRDAVQRGYRVGVADLYSHSVKWYDLNQGLFQTWMQDQDTFGRHQKYQAIRYVISDLKS